MRSLFWRRQIREVIDSSFGGNASELARAIDCEPATVSAWRTVGQVPSGPLMKRLAVITGRSEHWFTGGLSASDEQTELTHLRAENAALKEALAAYQKLLELKGC